MNVSLTPELERFVQSRVESGLYKSSSEVIREALRILWERERLRTSDMEQLKADLQVGLDQLDAGQSRPVDVEEIKRRGRARLGIDE